MQNFAIVVAAAMVLSGCNENIVEVSPPACLKEIFPGEETFTEYVLVDKHRRNPEEPASRTHYAVPRSAWTFEFDRKYPPRIGEGLLLALPGDEKASYWTGHISVSIFPFDEAFGFPAESSLRAVGYAYSQDGSTTRKNKMIATGDAIARWARDGWDIFFALGESGRPEYSMRCRNTQVAKPSCTVIGGVTSRIEVRLAKEDKMEWYHAFNRAAKFEECMRIGE